MSDELMELPEGWVWKPFEELVVNHDGRRIPVSSTDRQQRQGDFPYYGASGIIDYVDDYLFDGDYLLIAEDGANLISRSTPIAFEATGKFWVNNHAHILQPVKEIILTSYLQDYFNFTDLRFYISGSAQPKLNQKNLNRIPVPLPPLNEQRRIVAKIEELRERSQKARSALSAIPNLCDKFRQSVLAAAFRGDLTADWREQNPEVEPASVLLERIRRDRRKQWEARQLEKMKLQRKVPTNNKWKDKYQEPTSPDTSDLPEIPVSWHWVKLISLLLEVADVDHKMPKAQEEGIPYISPRDFLPKGLIDFEGAKKISEEDFLGLCRKICPEKGDILLSRYGTVGEVRLIQKEQSFQASYSIAILKKVSENLNKFIALGLTSEPLQTQIEYWSRGVTQADLGLAHIKEFAFPIPPEEEQDEIFMRVESAMHLIHIIEEQYQGIKEKLNQLDRSILAKAFRGELVEQDPNDEPASVLLERIRADREQQAQGKKGKRTMKTASM